MAEGPGPTVTIIEDVDPEPGIGAWWGEVNTHLHRHYRRLLRNHCPMRGRAKGPAKRH